MGQSECDTKIKVIVPIHSYPTRNREFQKNSKDMQKIKEQHYGLISSQNRMGQVESDTKKKNLSFRFIPSRSGIWNSKKLAKKCKNLKDIITPSFQAKMVRDRLRMKEKKIIVPTQSREF